MELLSPEVNQEVERLPEYLQDDNYIVRVRGERED